MAYSPAFQFYPDDFTGDKNTIRMTTVEIGAYWLLICECWDKDNQLPNDLSELADIARMDVEDFRPIWERRIKRCFIFDERKKTYFHKRLSEEIKKQKSWSRKKSEAGKRGAANRWKQKSNSDGTAMALPSSAMALNGSSSLSSSSSLNSLSSKKQTGDEFVRSLRENPAYTGINIDVELARAEAWAEKHSRPLTRRFITGWMDRAEPPLEISASKRPSSNDPPDLSEKLKADAEARKLMNPPQQKAALRLAK